MSTDLPKTGDVFEHYQIDACIGRGGFACVYRARDLRLGREVALKVVSLAEHSEDRLQRVLREAELSRMLAHPHTVRVYDYGRDHQGRPFIAFELLEGETLQQRMRRMRAVLHRRDSSHRRVRLEVA